MKIIMSLPLPLPETLAWWTANDDADRNVAQRGCTKVVQACTTCRVERCPQALRLCRVCAFWGSALGWVGMCERDGKVVRPSYGCDKWEGRP